MNENNIPNMQANAAGMPQNMKIDDKAVKRMAGEAVLQVEGVLGTEGGLTDVMKANDDVTRGISLAMAEDGKRAEIGAKIILEYGKNAPKVVAEVQRKVADALMSMAGIAVDRVEVEVADTMTREEYKMQHSEGH